MIKRSQLFYTTILALRQSQTRYLLPSMLKRRCGLSYFRSAKLWEELAAHGIVEDFPADHSHAPRVIWDRVKRIRVPEAAKTRAVRSPLLIKR